MPMFDYFLNRKAVIFDLDGTISDTEKVWHDAISKTASKELSIAYIEFHDLDRGMSLHDKWTQITKELAPNTDVKIDYLAQKTFDNLLVSLEKPGLEIEPKEGFWELAAYLKTELKYKIALATNSYRDAATAIINKLEIDGIFDYEIYGNEIKHSKPNPEIYQKCAAELGVKSNEVLVIEDSLIGAFAAQKAGMEALIMIKNEEEIEKFPENCVDFSYDFVMFARNIGKEYKDMMFDPETQQKVIELFNKLNLNVGNAKE